MKTVQIGSWQEFRNFVDQDRQIMPVYWRGQKNPAWPLASMYEREILKLSGGGLPRASMLYPYDNRLQRDGRPIWEGNYYRGMRDGYLAAFKRAARGLRGSAPKDLSDEEWWALGRHYGLITPLLDWTDKPYIAAFFALSDLWRETSVGGPNSATYVFNGRQVAVYRLFHNQQLEGDGLRVVRPVVEELGRLHGQRGLFTWLDSEKYFELQGFLDDTGRSNLLTQLLISDQALTDGLRDLYAHGVDYRTLFPDLEGAALQVNIRLPFW